MIPSLQKYKFHEAIGYLSYAIAAADKKVKAQEVETLKQIIQTDWLSSEDPIEALFQIQIVFDRLNEHAVSGEAAFNTFALFKKNNEVLFTEEIKQRIWKTVNSIAESVAGKNKSELVMLSKLSTIMK